MCDSFYNDDLERWDNWERKNAKAFDKEEQSLQVVEAVFDKRVGFWG